MHRLAQVLTSRLIASIRMEGRGVQVIENTYANASGTRSLRFLAASEDRFIGSLGSIIIGDIDDGERREPNALEERRTAAEDSAIELAAYERTTDEEAGSRETG